MGTHILGIKDMAGLCKPYAAARAGQGPARGSRMFPSTSTRTTPAGSTPAAFCAPATPAWISSTPPSPAMSGVTSQPNLNSLVAALQNTPRDTRTGFERPERPGRLLGSGPRSILSVRRKPEGRLGAGVSARNARRAVHQSSPAGQEPRPGRPLEPDRRRVRAGEPALRRHREGDAVEQSRRRHGVVHGHQRPDRPWTC